MVAATGLQWKRFCVCMLMNSRFELIDDDYDDELEFWHNVIILMTFLVFNMTGENTLDHFASDGVCTIRRL